MNETLIKFLNTIEDSYTWNNVLTDLQQNDLYAALFKVTLTGNYKKDIQALRKIYTEYINKIKN